MTLYHEIFEQAHVLEELLSSQMDVIQEIAAAIRQRAPAYVFLAARGTSDNAGRYANYLWGSLNGLPVALATPSLFTYYQRPPQLKDALVVGISQSGQSPDIVSVLEQGRSQGNMTLAISNAPDSPLARAADFVIDIRAGVEAAVAATKSYTAQLMAIAMLSTALNQDAEQSRALACVPGWVGQALALDESIARIAERYRYMQQCVVIGRGYNYATAFEWSLKLKELTYVVAEPYSSADFRHGPIAMVDSGFPVMAVNPSGKVYDDILALLQRLHQDLCAELVVISDQRPALDLAQSPLPLPEGIPEWLTPLAAIVPAQLFAYHLTRARGLDTEKPRAIRKVTETR
ncbi:MAG: SIS domain-containing protein [Anaerolineales bacterium]|nr:SIS domain-containing protein [Anaerolineales bacterium]